MAASKNSKQMKCASCGGKLVKIGDGLYKCALCGKKKRVESEETSADVTLTAPAETPQKAAAPAKKKPEQKKPVDAASGAKKSEKIGEEEKQAPQKSVPRGKDAKKKVVPGKQKKGQKPPVPYKKNVKQEKSVAKDENLLVGATESETRPAQRPAPEPVYVADPATAKFVTPGHEKAMSRPDGFGEPLDDIDLVIPPFPYERKGELTVIPKVPGQDVKTCGNARICDVAKRTYERGVKDGEGSFTCPNGTMYAGSLKEGLREGKGKTTYRNGDTYEGEYAGDVACGKGIMTKKDGSMYAGMFEGDKWCGEGIYRDMFGYLHVGTFGYLTFEGRTYLPDEDAISGDELYNKVESWFAE
ncbi:MAG: hypothetical protein LUD47_01025 [Clostridia bacterium]|nr:hypothetical protein [Clostridia bacterium]